LSAVEGSVKVSMLLNYLHGRVRVRVRVRVSQACHDPDFIPAKGIIRWL